MSLTAVSGVITQLRERAELRVDNRPARFAAAFNASIGDKVVAAGKNAAELEVIALRNDTTQLIYHVGITSIPAIAFMLAVPFLAVALMLYDTSWAFAGFLFLLMGLISFPVGLLALYKRKVTHEAVRMVEHAPRT